MPEQTGRDILLGWRTDRDEKRIWGKAYADLMGEFELYRDEVASLNNQLEEQLYSERGAWKKSLQKARGPGFGVFAGAGTGGLIAGVGIVWRVF